MEMDDPFGAFIYGNWYTAEGRGVDHYEIAGVVEDFHTVGLQSEATLIIKVMKRAEEDIQLHTRHARVGGSSLGSITNLIPSLGPATKTNAGSLNASAAE